MASKSLMSRRGVLCGLAGTALASLAPPAHAGTSTANGTSTGTGRLGLAARAAARGITFGASFATHELDRSYGQAYADVYRADAHLLTSELEFKMSALRPTAEAVDYAGADRLVQFAADNAMRVRAHTLIWNDDLPDWIKRLPAREVELLLERHITETMARYGTRVAMWDVVNEPIGPWDRNPGNLRGGAFYAAMGEDYIRRAFAFARAASPSATLVLNEAQLETADANGETFRSSFLALLRRLHDAGAAIDAVGIQSHLKLAARYDLPAFTDYLSQIAELGYKIHITELDVNDTGARGSVRARDLQTAHLYRRYLSAVLKVPAVNTVQLWQLSDRTSWMQDAETARRMNIRADARPLPYDANFARKPAWFAIARALSTASPR